MRCTPASYAKTLGKKSGTRQLRDAPGNGTKLRANWDVLQANKGVPVELAGEPRYIAMQIVQLVDFYGLDIRQVQRGFHGGDISRPSLYVLAGEWFGRVYIDYIAEHINSSQPERVA